jgi:hypothetical protein
MSEVQHWHEQQGRLWMENDGLRLVVHPPSAERYVRFVVIDHHGPDHHPDRLIGSGTFENVAAAKDAAERMAERFVTPGRHGPDQRRDGSASHSLSAPITAPCRAFIPPESPKPPAKIAGRQYEEPGSIERVLS